MQPYDILMLVVFLGAAVFGAWKGMAWQLASIGSLLLSSVVALRFGGLVAPMFSSEEPWNRFLAMAALFVGTSLAVWIAFRFVAKVIDRVKLKEFDRQMGALLGAGKGVIYCLVITFFAVTLNEATRTRVLESKAGRYAALLIEKGRPLMPEDVHQALGKYIDRLDQGLEGGATASGGTTGTIDTTALESMVDSVVGQTPEGAARAWEPEAWQRDAQEVVTQEIDRFGTRLDQALEDSYSRIRTSVGETTEQVQTDVNRQFDELGRRIRRAPMEPVR